MEHSSGTLKYKGVEYKVAGDGWEERQWKLGMADVMANSHWYWLSVQIKGCLDKRGRKTAKCGSTMRTIAAWANYDRADGHVIGHYYNEVAPPPRCEGYDLAKPEDWTLTPSRSVISAEGIPYATAARLVVPSRKIDLQAVQKVPGATVNPGVFEGVVDVRGTINGERVWGVGMFEELGATKPK